MYATQNVAKQSQDFKAAFVVSHADDKSFISGQVYLQGNNSGDGRKVF